MSGWFLFKGFFVGVSIAVPMGPVAILAIQRTLNFSRKSGLFTGLGAATADVIFGLFAAMGLSLVTDLLIEHQVLFRCLGGSVLLFLGIQNYRRRVASATAPIPHRSLLSDYLSTIFLTLANPLTFVAIVAIFAGLGLDDKGTHWFSTSQVILGLFLGSSLWWFTLTELIIKARTKVSIGLLHKLNKISGVILMVFAAVAFLSVLQLWQ